jgi:alkanesulfonate monooxygenase SsuD/methylene tetrahydromethanopterin reductase-like flavin-dependent oxidoreductase (luciferase family)
MPAERYRLGAEQILHAERCGFDSAWIAQHHFHENEGGLPAPFVFLGHVAARTSRIRLGTGIVTLPLEMPLRVAEDAAVLDLMSGEPAGARHRPRRQCLGLQRPSGWTAPSEAGSSARTRRC